MGTTDRELIGLIPAVTGNFTFVPLGLRTRAESKEIFLRYFALSFLEGYSEEQAWHRYSELPGPLGQPWAQLLSHMPYLLTGAVVPLTEAQEIKVRLYRSPPPTEVFADRRLDFLIVPAHGSADRLALIGRSAELVHGNTDWKLIRLKH